MQAEMQDRNYSHDVFISYSRHNKEFARVLERALRAYQPPPGLNLPQRDLAVVARQLADEQRQEAVKQRNYAVANETRARRLLYVSNMNLAQKEFDADNLPQTQNVLNQYLRYLDTSFWADERDFYWRYLWRLNHDECATLKGRVERVEAVAVAADGRWLASGGEDKLIRLWCGATDKEVKAQRNN